MLNVDPVCVPLEEEEEETGAEEEEGGLFRRFFASEVMAASIASLLEEISGVEEPIEELQVLKTALFSIPVSALRDCVSGQRFNVIFSLLNSNQRLVSITHFFYTVSKLVAGNC